MILVGNTPYLFDFGVNVVRQVAALTQQYSGPLEELLVENLSTAFCTHLHSDHTLGFPDIILTPWIMGREKPLSVYGPSGIKEMAENIQKAYEVDIRYRINGTEPINESGWKTDIHEINEGKIYSDQHLTVEAFCVAHGEMEEAFGFRCTTSDKTIVISGDTTPCENILTYAKNADILIHEVYSQKGFAQLKPEWQAYHSSHHTSARQLADIANKTKPGLLIAYHTLYWGLNDDDLLSEVKAGYDGEVVIGKDLQIFI